MAQNICKGPRLCQAEFKLFCCNKNVYFVFIPPKNTIFRVYKSAFKSYGPIYTISSHLFVCILYHFFCTVQSVLTQNGTPERTPFSGIVFHANWFVSSKNYILNGFLTRPAANTRINLHVNGECQCLHGLFMRSIFYEVTWAIGKVWYKGRRRHFTREKIASAVVHPGDFRGVIGNIPATFSEKSPRDTKRKKELGA